jgi:hypothetical protein
MVARLSLLTHMGDVAALAVVFVVCAALSAKVFHWESNLLTACRRVAAGRSLTK